MDLAANLLLAAGASPATVQSAEELSDFIAAIDALTVNLGTPSQARVEAMALAAREAVAQGKPWVLDPVGVGATPFRLEAGRRLADLRPTVIRGNAAEILTLGEAGGALTHGLESASDSAEALDAARDLARRTGAVVAVTGGVDYVTDGQRIVAVANGHSLMTKVTGMGCALTCLIGACCAVEPEPIAASAAGLAIMGVAGEIAAAEAAGPGSFRSRFLDVLYNLDQATLTDNARVE